MSFWICLLSHTLRGCVDWNAMNLSVSKEKTSHTLRGCVDWNCWSYMYVCCIACHTLRGCVDWNIVCLSIGVLVRVTPFVGVWIETFGQCQKNEGLRVTPFVGVWIETLMANMDQLPCVVTPFVGVWIETWNILLSSGRIVSHPSWVCGLKHLIGTTSLSY